MRRRRDERRGRRREVVQADVENPGVLENKNRKRKRKRLCAVRMATSRRS
jgi:hypothetical protein